MILEEVEKLEVGDVFIFNVMKNGDFVKAAIMEKPEFSPRPYPHEDSILVSCKILGFKNEETKAVVSYVNVFSSNIEKSELNTEQSQILTSKMLS